MTLFLFKIRKDSIPSEIPKKHEPYPPDLGQLDQRHVRQRRVHLAGGRGQGPGFKGQGSGFRVQDSGFRV